jgi:hypothetical protein
VMAILGDPEKRELYDQTGSIAAADIDGDAVKSLYKFLRTLFKQVTSFVQIRLFFAFFCFFWNWVLVHFSVLQVTEEDIDAFSASYRGSKEEEKDLLASYTKFKGDLKKYDALPLFRSSLCWFFDVHGYVGWMCMFMWCGIDFLGDVQSVQSDDVLWPASWFASVHGHHRCGGSCWWAERVQSLSKMGFRGCQDRSASESSWSFKVRLFDELMD